MIKNEKLKNQSEKWQLKMSKSNDIEHDFNFITLHCHFTFWDLHFKLNNKYEIFNTKKMEEGRQNLQ